MNGTRSNLEIGFGIEIIPTILRQSAVCDGYECMKKVLTKPACKDLPAVDQEQTYVVMHECVV